MKKKWMILPVIAISFGCTREIDTNVTYINGEFTIYAASGENDTRTVLQKDGRVFWSPSDCITVFYGNVPGKFTSTNTEPAASAEFAGSLGSFAIDGEKEFRAIYPHSNDIVTPTDEGILSIGLPWEQTGVEGTFADDLFICVAKSKDFYLNFYNVCGGVKFSLTRGDIKKIVFRGNNRETLAGRMAVEFDSNGIPQVTDMTGGKSSVTLLAPDGGTFKAGAFYYLVLVPQSLTKGYTMELWTDELVETVSSEASVTVRRSVWGVLKNLGTTSNGEVNGAVDLGLPSGLLWGSCNLGATRAEGYGDYYAWGEITPYYEPEYAQSENPLWKPGKEAGYAWSSYGLCMGTSNTLIKYCDNPDKGYEYTEDSKTVLDPDDDAAQVVLGEKWRIPTIDEWRELRDNCTFTWIEKNGVYGSQVVSKINGNSIFLPGSGNRVDTSLSKLGTEGSYWSSSLSPNVQGVGPTYAQFVYFYTNRANLQFSNYDRFRGFSIRPVYGDPSIPIESISLNENSLELMVDEKVKLTTVILPDNASHKSIIWSSSNESVATISQTGVITGVSEGETIVSAISVYGKIKADCRVSVKPIPVPELVDLGLSVMWAAFNLGAEKPEESGFYYAWGETTPKSVYNNKVPYKWSEGRSYTKYNTKSEYGLVDNKTQLDPEDDAATVAFGSGWHIPTVDEISELVENCSWSNKTVNGVRGYIIHSNINNNEIFIPETSYWEGYSYSIRNDFNYGWYWSSSLNQEFPYSSFCLFFDSQYYHVLEEMNRDNGCPIRPVYGVSSTKPEIKTPEPVDLGLSVKWASFNLGASKPEEYGDYYAWGETEPYYSSLDPLIWKEGKEAGYDWASYKWCNGSHLSLTKYCTSSTYGYNGFTDGKNVLDPEDDAAHITLGGKWRMPTVEEWTELYENCNWDWTSVNGVFGREVIGPNGKSIFLPESGEWHGTQHNSNGSYWTPSLSHSWVFRAEIGYFDSTQVRLGVWGGCWSNRSDGLPIRPVYTE